MLAVSEALSNAVEHAYPDQRPGPVRLRGTSTPPAPVALSAPGAGHRPVVAEDVVSGAVLQIVVSDRGRWLPPGEPQYRGRGLAIMRATAEDVDLTHTTTGTTVRLTWTLPSGA